MTFFISHPTPTAMSRLPVLFGEGLGQRRLNADEQREVESRRNLKAPALALDLVNARDDRGNLLFPHLAASGHQFYLAPSFESSLQGPSLLPSPPPP